MGWEASPKARAKSAERALETALLNRFGWVGGAPAVLKLRSDNGLVFASKLHRGLCREYGLAQEFITPYTPEENGLVERFMRSLKEERAWLHNVSSLEEAREVIRNWVAWHDTERPRQTLNYKTPQEARKERENQPRELSKMGAHYKALRSSERGRKGASRECPLSR